MSDTLKCFAFPSDHGDRDMDDWNFCKSWESSKEVQEYLFDAAEIMVDLCLSSSASKVENLISVLRQERLDVKTLKEYM